MPIRKTTGALHLVRAGKRTVIEPNTVVELTEDELKKIEHINPLCLVTVTEAEADKWVAANRHTKALEAEGAARVEAAAKADAEAKAEAEAAAKAEAEAKAKAKAGGKGKGSTSADDEL